MTEPRRTHRDYTVGWICALEVEQAAARASLDQEHPRLPSIPGDPNRYRFGCVAGHNVVIACLPDGEMGNNPATAVVTRMSTNFSSLKFGLMVGIGGGVPSPPSYDDIRLGDVVVSSANNQSGGVIQYDRGKTVQGGDFQRTGILGRPPEILRQAVADLRATHRLKRGRLAEYLAQIISTYITFASPVTTLGLQDILFKAEYDHPKGSDFPTCEYCDSTQIIQRSARSLDPVVHYGVIASGNQVMKNGLERDRISRAHGGVLCFEMEAAGLMNTFPCLVIRGICDYSDSHKNKEWQAYAAATAAAYAKELLSEIEPAGVDRTPTAAATVNPTFIMPFVRDVKFVGRDAILDLIEKRHQAGCRVSVAGIGGIGKSQIAIEYAYRFREKYPQSHIFWVYGANHARFEQAYTEIAEQLNIPRRDDPKVNIKKPVLDWLSNKSHGRWLMILDNADDRSLYFHKVDANTSYDSNMQLSLADYLPLGSSEHGSLIVTTRNKKLGTDLADGEEPIVINPLIPREAELLLELNVVKDRWDAVAARNLLEVLGYIPLAITQAAAYMRQNEISIEKYFKALGQSDSNLAQYLSTELLDPRRQRDVPSSVFLTWKLSFDQISKDEPRAAQMLSLMAFLDRQGIPEALLRQGRHLDVNDTNAIGTLQAFSLITKERDDETYSMHRLVQLSTHIWLGLQDSQDRWQEEALQLLAEEFPNGEHENWKTCIALQPHTIAVLNYSVSSDSNLLHRATILHNLAWFDWRQGRYKSAIRYCQESHIERQRILGQDNLYTLDALGLLALLYNSQGWWREAEELDVQAIEMKKRTLGAEHPGTLASMSNLTTTYMNQGRWMEAKELIVQVIETRKRAQGAEHPETLVSMSKLTTTYMNQGRWKEAEELIVQVIETRKRVQGAEHPETLVSMNNLSAAYMDQGRWKEAEELMLKVIETGKRVLGAEHPSTLASINNLSAAYVDQGRWKEAEELIMQVMETGKRVLGAEHPQMLTSMKNLAHIFYLQRRTEEAIQLMDQVCKTTKATMGPEHPYTLQSSMLLHAWIQRT